MTSTESQHELRFGKEGYPELLSQIQLPPEVLYTRGQYLAEDTLAVAIVGARTPTPYGIWASEKLAHGLARNGFTVVSGMARGIDTAAHKAALAAGGRTIGVLGCGLDVDYPRGSSDLRRQISQRGVLATEFKNGTSPLPYNFPQRNRIISGLSLAVVVIEAGLKSGSLITARWALDQGREVMAVPGRIDSRMSDGPNSLIGDGALPVREAEDIVLALGMETTDPLKDHAEGVSDFIRELTGGAKRLEELASSSGRSVSDIMAELTRLEIQGTVKRMAGGYFTLTGKQADRHTGQDKNS